MIEGEKWNTDFHGFYTDKQTALLVSLGLLCGPVVVHAQALYPTTTTRQPIAPRSGRIVISPHRDEAVVSLDQLIRMSPLIIEGVVRAVLLSIERRADLVGTIETHSLVTVVQTLRGEPDGRSEITVVQEGGVYGDHEVVNAEDPLVEVGERYIFFLAGSRTRLPNTDGSPLYRAVAYWSGMGRVDNPGNITFPPRSLEEVRGLREFEGGKTNAFIAAVRERVVALSPKAQPYPGGR